MLIGLVLIGLFHWAPDQLTAGIEPQGLLGALAGAAVIFIAFEGFQLLTYDCDEIRNPERLLPLASLSAVAAVILVFLFSFATVNTLALVQKTSRRWAALLGLIGSTAAGLVSLWHMLLHDQAVLLGLVALVLLTTVGRPHLLRYARQLSSEASDAPAHRKELSDREEREQSQDQQ